MWDVIIHLYPNFKGNLVAIQIRTWISNYIPVYMDVIMYPCPNPDADLVYLC